MDESKEGPVVVLGAGPGGYAAAFALADHGKEVVLIDEGIAPGGVCLHRGCIPSKALLHVAKLLNEAREAGQWGIEFAAPKIDLDKLRSFKSSVVEKLTGGVSELARRRGVKLIRGRAKFTSETELRIDPISSDKQGKAETLRFSHCIVATGSKPAMPPMFDIGDPRVMDSTAALELPDVPKKLLVIGGGYIGLELGSVYASLGSRVTVVELTDGLLPGADRDLVRPLQKRLEGHFEKILLETKVTSIKGTVAGIEASLESKEGTTKSVFDRVLVAVGRRPNSQGLGLENTRVIINQKGFIEVDDGQRTSEPSILAIGDVAGEPMLAHKASREARVAAEVLSGEPARFDSIAIPAVVFTDPEVAWCGMTETEAKSRKLDVDIQRFPWAASGRAQTISRTEGMTKIIFEKETGRVLGVGIVGASAGEMIAEGVLAVESASVAYDLASSIHPHPTLSETIMESAESFFGNATHLYRPKKT